MIRRPPRSTQSRSSAASDVYKRQVLEGLVDKLIRRHPHIFGEAEAKDTAEVLRQWERIKKTEAHSAGLESILDLSLIHISEPTRPY